MKTKDFINIGVFTAIYFVIAFGFAMMGILGPIAMFAGYALGLIANGIVITLFKARVPKLGALALTGFIVGLLMFVMGHPWVVIIVAPVLGLLGDLCYAKNIKIMRILGYAIFSLWYVTPWFPVFIDRAAYRAYIVKSMGEDYAQSLEWFLNPMMICLWALAVFVLGLIGGLFGESVMGRHFRKSGAAK